MRVLSFIASSLKYAVAPNTKRTAASKFFTSHNTDNKNDPAGQLISVLHGRMAPHSAEDQRIFILGGGSLRALQHLSTQTCGKEFWG